MPHESYHLIDRVMKKKSPTLQPRTQSLVILSPSAQKLIKVAISVIYGLEEKDLDARGTS